MTVDSEFLTELKRTVQDTALSRLKQLVLRADLVIAEDASGDFAFAPWLVLILVSGPQIRITFKTYFKSRVARSLAAPLFRVEPQAIRTEQAIDLMREYCNLTAGGLKKALGESGFATGVSLPVVTRGFDDLFFVADQGAGTTHHWRISLKEGESILVSAFIEVFDSIPRILDDSGAKGGQ